MKRQEIAKEPDKLWIKLPLALQLTTLVWASHFPFLKPISGRVDRASATETVDLGSTPSRVKPKTTKIVIYRFPAWRLAIKGTVWSLHRV